MSFDLKISQGDLVIGQNGDFTKTENTEKLIQDILKIALTPLGGNQFFPFYGSPISRTLIGNAFNFEFISTMASNQLRTSLETLQKLQKLQLSAGQKLTAEEMLAAIQNVTIERNQTDPRFFRVIIQALSRSMTPVTTSFDVSV